MDDGRGGAGEPGGMGLTDTSGDGAGADGRAGRRPAAGPAPRRGLTREQVAQQVAGGRVNQVPARTSRSVADIVRANFFTRINAIIGVLLAVILVVGPIQDALFGGVIVANTLIGIVQEIRAKRTLDRLAIISQTRPTVWRDGVKCSLSAADIVLGDLVDLGPGDRVLVDGTVVESDNLEIDESLLTGEADPVAKQPGDSVMSGSFVVAGAGAVTATGVGRQAYAAQLAEEARRFTLVNSELRNGINQILRFVTYAIIPAGVALIITQLIVNDNDLPEAIRRMVGGLVPMVPEGLVLITSVAFAIGVVRLGRQRCLVQELPAIEGLARVDTVCLDKTGTLTDATMDVKEIHRLRQEVPVEKVLGALGAADERPNASMQAIVRSYPVPPDWELLGAIPFSSARGWSAAAFAQPPGAVSTWLLGAPELLLPAGHGAVVAADAFGARGLRVLLLARSHGPTPDELLADASRVADASEPIALVVLSQRIRQDAPATLRYFAQQSTAVKVISGDNPLSVSAVAASLGLRGAEHAVDARLLPQETSDLAAAVEDNTIFGRVGPQRKRDMVGALQSRGHIVAMTGDGVNDVLALKDSDIGVAMGSGSPATRAVAQIVLLDNNFSALPAVVAEGRRVICNIERVANLFLTKTVYSVLLAVVVVLAQVPYPFLPRHLTLVGSLTIGIPAFFLALAPNHERAMPHFARRVLRFAVPAGLLAALATTASYFVARSVYDDNLDAETSAATMTLFLTALWALAIIARPYTWWRILLVLAMGLSFAVVLVVPYLQDFFQLELVGVVAPWCAAGLGVVAGLLLELYRLLGSRGGPPRDRDGR